MQHGDTSRPKKAQRRHLPLYRLSWVNFHSFRHTCASWMRRYAGADLQALVATGNGGTCAARAVTRTPSRATSGNASRARLRSETVENPWTRRNRQPNSLIHYVSPGSSPETGRTFFSHPRQHPLHAPQRPLLAGADILSTAEKQRAFSPSDYPEVRGAQRRHTRFCDIHRLIVAVVDDCTRHATEDRLDYIQELSACSRDNLYYLFTGRTVADR